MYDVYLPIIVIFYCILDLSHHCKLYMSVQFLTYPNLDHVLLRLNCSEWAYAATFPGGVSNRYAPSRMGFPLGTHHFITGYYVPF